MYFCNQGVTFAAVAAITAALSLAIVPALTNQAFAHDCPGCHSQGHQVEEEPECVNTSSGKEKEGECPGGSLNSPNKQEEREVTAGKSDNVKGERVDKGSK